MNSFAENLLITVIMTAGTKLFSVLWQIAKTEYRKNKKQAPDSRFQKSTVRIQFFISFSLGILSLILSPLIPDYFRTFVGILAFFSFMVVWGCFDTACEFWADESLNEKIDNKPNDKTD